METKIIKIGTSLGLIIPGTIIKSSNLKFGTKLEIKLRKGGELVITPKANVREGWAEAFATYAKEGEDDLILPDFMDAETDLLL